MNDLLLEWIGYIASLIVLISLLMSSIKKLRWINLFGALLFGIYGFMISSLPTGFMNVGIAIIDIYFLAKIYLSKEYFRILPFDKDSQYVRQFIDFYQNDIEKISNLTDKLDSADVRFYILRNMQPAGLFIGKKYNDNTLEILLDYAIPQYRDFKLGNYIFEKELNYFKEKGYTQFVTYTDEESHIKYVKKMGFTETLIDGTKAYVKEI